MLESLDIIKGPTKDLSQHRIVKVWENILKPELTVTDSSNNNKDDNNYSNRDDREYGRDEVVVVVEVEVR